MLSKMNGQSCFQRFPAAGRCSRRFHSTYHHRKTRHRSKSIAGISTPDSFLASASQGLSLESEEMDKERSLLAIGTTTASPLPATTIFAIVTCQPTGAHPFNAPFELPYLAWKTRFRLRQSNAHRGNGYSSEETEVVIISRICKERAAAM